MARAAALRFAMGHFTEYLYDCKQTVVPADPAWMVKTRSCMFNDGDVLILRQHTPADDPRQRQPDISLARKLLDWDPTVQLQDGLKKTVEYFEGRMRRGLVS